MNKLTKNNKFSTQIVYLLNKVNIKSKINDMYILIFIFWLILNQKITIEIILFGIGIEVIVLTITNKLFDYNIKKDLRMLKKLPLLIRYLFILMIEVLKASFTMMKIILNKEIKIEPVLVSFKSGLKSDFANFLLANSITLTPGTITKSQDKDNFVVHCLRRDMLDTNKDSVFIKNLREIEEK